jgi:hypothetical protein
MVNKQQQHYSILLDIDTAFRLYAFDDEFVRPMPTRNVSCKLDKHASIAMMNVTSIDIGYRTDSIHVTSIGSSGSSSSSSKIYIRKYRLIHMR